MKNPSLTNTITVITPVKHDRIHDLREFMANVKQNMINNEHPSFEQINIHFARWTIIDFPKPVDGPPPGTVPKLVFIADFDGPVEKFVEDLCTISMDIVDSVYDCCHDYPLPDDRNLESRRKFVDQHTIPSAAVYRGAPGRSLQQIRDENNLRGAMRVMLNATDMTGKSGIEVHQWLKQQILSNPEFDWVKEPIKLPKVNYFGMALVGIVLLLLLPIVIIWILILHYRHEIKDTNFTLNRSGIKEAHYANLQEYEDLENQNQFTQLVVMKKGWMRLVTIKALFIFANTLIKYLFVEGKLMGIPTIHYARWVLFDDNKRVLFFSNFDGSWQQYLGDFIDKSGWGLTGIFSNTVNFPKTNFLFTGGAYDEEHFLAWSRYSELPTQIWYSAYAHLSIKNVNNNSLIRSQFMKTMNEKDTLNFLKLI